MHFSPKRQVSVSTKEYKSPGEGAGEGAAVSSAGGGATVIVEITKEQKKQIDSKIETYIKNLGYSEELTNLIIDLLKTISRQNNINVSLDVKNFLKTKQQPDKLVDLMRVLIEIIPAFTNYYNTTCQRITKSNRTLLFNLAESTSTSIPYIIETRV